jgi:hypothetical protein
VSNRYTLPPVLKEHFFCLIRLTGERHPETAARPQRLHLDKVRRLADNCSGLQWLLFDIPLIAAQVSELGALLLEYLD